MPERAANAPSGRALVERLQSLAAAEREEQILAQILAGNLPTFLRRLCPVTVTHVTSGRTNSGTFFVMPDYLSVGADEDFLLTPLSPSTAQRLADQLGCTLPTRRMVDAIYAAAEVKLAPAPIAPSPAMTTVPVFALHCDMVRTQRLASLTAHPPGALTAGHKKDMVLSAKLAGALGKVALYGWHRTNGMAIQPLYLGHTATWVDYSHGMRLVQQRLTVNGVTTTVAQILADPKLADLLSDEGPIANPRYPTNALPSPPAGRSSQPASAVEFKPSGPWGERVASLAIEPEVKIQLNVPVPADFAPDKPVSLILYALPNGNTTAQTIGRSLQPGDDWHFDIQHIGAQTRFLRGLVTNRTVVVAYLEAESRSWPAWRRKRGDEAIPEIVNAVRKLFPTNRLARKDHSGSKETAKHASDRL